jgi:dienelactone hydrolase
MKHLTACLILLGCSALPTWAAASDSQTLGSRTLDSQALDSQIKGTEVSYHSNGLTLKGYLATDPTQTGPRPGILVVHEWWGHDDYARKRARMLAALGYTALAVDMYGNGKQAAHPQDASTFSSEVANNMAMAEARFKAALKLLQAQPGVISSKVAAIGYCFGGAIVLEMARRGVPLVGVASFHGSLSTKQPAQKGKVKAKILVMNGDADPFVKPEQISALKQEMQAAGVDFEFVGYPDAQHSFTNPQADSYGQRFKLPLAYNAAADKASWSKMQGFFADLFR